VSAQGESRRRRGDLGKEQRGSPSDDGAEARKRLTGSPSGGGAGHVRPWRGGTSDGGAGDVRRGAVKPADQPVVGKTFPEIKRMMLRGSKSLSAGR
jgi:hypothetical protein